MIFLLKSFSNISNLVYNFILLNKLIAIFLLALCLFTLSDKQLLGFFLKKWLSSEGL